MLTKQDFSQIKKIVRGEVVSESEAIKSDLGSEIKQSRIEIQLKIRDLANRVKDVEQQSRENGKNIIELKKDVKKIDKRLDEGFNFLDKEHVNLVKRVKRVETHLNIQPIADY